MSTSTDSISFDDFIAMLPPERQEPVRQVWEAVRAAMPAGYTEQIGPKFLQYSAGKESYVALASQKNYISLYLMPLYVFAGRHREKLEAATPRPKGGKSCLNFKRAEELPLSVIQDIVRAHLPAEYLAQLEANRTTPPSC
ncbi:DUF1801 domain-containing protein [Hymenobacter sp. BT175]|uniref:DUF1801 domain-containing protein n=1 Tax=Hymenobacter translucens TaxID=2886507 RepID=UPI001D0E095E|nr:DUF1801 domain-containing protein [Hymenobacter translucens]MCC2546808.1 DUF1801 domain-containing protein [Hymenobacter translucens]